MLPDIFLKTGYNILQLLEVSNAQLKYEHPQRSPRQPNPKQVIEMAPPRRSLRRCSQAGGFPASHPGVPRGVPA